MRRRFGGLRVAPSSSESLTRLRFRDCTVDDWPSTLVSLLPEREGRGEGSDDGAEEEDKEDGLEGVDC